MIVDQGPGVATVVRAEESPLLRLDQRVDAPAVGGRHRHADLPPDALREAVPGELRPGVAAVARPVETAPRPAARHLPRPTARLPESGEQDVGVRRVEADVGGARGVVLLEDLSPGPAAVLRAVDAARRVGPEGVAEDGGEGEVGVRGMDDHGSDLPLLRPDVRPGLPSVGRLVDPVARGDVSPDVGLARADIDDAGIGRGDGDRADGRVRLIVEDRPPRDASVVRGPDAARGGGGVVDEGAPRHAGHARHASPDRRTDQPELQALELGRTLGDLPGLLGGPCGNGGDEHGGEQRDGGLNATTDHGLSSLEIGPTPRGRVERRGILPSRGAVPPLRYPRVERASPPVPRG